APLEATLPVDSSGNVRRAAACVGAIRDEVGPDVAIGVDVLGRLSPAVSIRLARALEPLAILFLQGPAPPRPAGPPAAVARATPVPIATGERLFTKWGFREVVELRAAALLQPDVSHCGGILEARLIAALGETIYAGFAPHNPLSPVNTVASAHVGMAPPRFGALEDAGGSPPWTLGLV